MKTRDGKSKSSKGNSQGDKVIPDKWVIAISSPEAFVARLEDRERRKVLINEMRAVTVGLRADVGMFGAEFFDPDLRPKDYADVERTLAQHDDDLTNQK